MDGKVPSVLREQTNRTSPSLPVAKMKEEGEGISESSKELSAKHSKKD